MFAWIWLIFVVVPVLMLVLYAAGIQYEAGGVCWGLLPVVLLAFILDVVLNYTVFAIYTWDFRHWKTWKSGEYTFSQRMPRLIKQGGWRGTMCLMLAFALDVLCISGVHIKREPVAP